MLKRVLQYLFHYGHYGSLILIRLYSNLIVKVILSLKGGAINSGGKFFGVPFIYIYPGSVLKIGKNFELRTHVKSNMIGIKQRSMISVQSRDAEIIIGDNCGFSSVVLGAAHSIRIGNNVMIGANSLITDFDWHSMKSDEYYSGVPDGKPVFIGDNVFIGYSSTILKGVTIGENSVIGANSVVTRSIPANVVAAGNPCKVIRSMVADLM